MLGSHCSKTTAGELWPASNKVSQIGCAAKPSSFPTCRLQMPVRLQKTARTRGRHAGGRAVRSARFCVEIVKGAMVVQRFKHN